MSQIAFFILLMSGFYSVVIGLPSPNIPPLPSPTLTTQPIANPSSISTQSPVPHSNGTITIPTPAATNSKSSILIIPPPRYATNSSSPNSVSKSDSQRGWSPGDVGTVLFGCIGLVLGILTLWLTFWLSRQRFRFIIKQEIQDESQLRDLP